MSNDDFLIYFAGDLFDHKHLIGNHILSEYLNSESGGAYRCLLPQQHEQSDFRAVAIRNQDLRFVLECDLALFNMDGTDLDSGTVVEFMLAKMLDIPCVLLRTDFRAAGDQVKEGDPWNLMASGYPRSPTLIINGMSLYQSSVRTGANFHEEIYKKLSREIISHFQIARNGTSIFKNRQEIFDAYKLASKFPGTSFEDMIKQYGGDTYLANIVDSKIRKGLY